MIASLALLAVAQTATIDWASLPPLAYRAPPIVTPAMNDFVKRDIALRNCPLPKGKPMVVEVAVLVDEASAIRVTVPRAIQCATVEQYAAALVAGFARNNLLPRSSGGEQWYRTSLTFSWTQ